MFWNRKNREVEFISTFGPQIVEPQPASYHIPDWFKRQRSFASEHSKSNVFLKNSLKPSFSSTVKRCFPVRDAITAGYIIPFPFDIAAKCMIDEDSGETVTGINCSGSYDSLQGAEPMGFHGKKQLDSHPYWDFYKHEEKAYKFHNPWVVKTPPGVSCIFQHPAHHPNQKWELFPGVVDTDVYGSNVLLPFVFKLKPGDEFVIKAGQPMVQVIPFIRDKWSHKVSYNPSEEQEIDLTKSNKKIDATIGRNRYKTWFWNKKEYK